VRRFAVRACAVLLGLTGSAVNALAAGNRKVSYAEPTKAEIEQAVNASMVSAGLDGNIKVEKVDCEKSQGAAGYDCDYIVLNPMIGGHEHGRFVKSNGK
jgi:hypothetical protein